MASLTIRKLDDALKKHLRLRAAHHGRSMEDEARNILRGAVAGGGEPAGRTGEARSERVVKGGARKADDAEHTPGASPVAGASSILLIIGGGIAAYKCLDLIRRLRERAYRVRVIMTRAAQEFVTPFSVGALAGERPFTDLFDPASEFDVGHIRLAREADLIVVAPATADMMARMAGGHADDLATAVLMAASSKILIAPAMNPHMWAHPATQRNLAQLVEDGIEVIGPNEGEMAESGERGIGRMAEPLEIAATIETLAARDNHGPLAGRCVIVTSGPTHEPIDPVRYIANRSSGKQGHAIAEAAARAGADVTLVSGPVNLSDPPGVKTVHVESARDMLAAVEKALPADVAIFAAAVADWRVAQAGPQKIKKAAGGAPELSLTENPDILATIAHRTAKRPQLVIGFAAETEKVVEHAKAKLNSKGCDWIVANDVSAKTGVMGGEDNTVHLVTGSGVESWPKQSKDDVARQLITRVAAAIAGLPQ